MSQNRKMTVDYPPNRRKFKSDWDAIDYLHQKILYWFYQRQDRRQALRFCPRMEHLLKKAAPDHEAILGEECWSLVYEVKGNLQKAIQYRENEIELIQKLWKTSEDARNEELIFKLFDYRDMSDRLDLLAMLYHETGDLDKALVVLQRSKSLCKSRSIRFDGEALLHDYLSEKNGHVAVFG